MTEKLKQCPFCGGDAILEEIGNDFTSKRSVVVRCTGCRVKRTDSAIKSSMEWLVNTAVSNWNMREP